jgi:hypothetical protein
MSVWTGQDIPEGTKIVSLSLADTTQYVKVAKTTHDGKQLYALYSDRGKYLGVTKTLEEISNSLKL